MEFFKENWFSFISTIFLILGLLYSNNNARNALKFSKDANDLAQNTLEKTKDRFVETYRPILLAEPVKMDDGEYYSFLEVGPTRAIITMFVSISNKGNVIASNAYIQEATIMIAANKKMFTNIRNQYDKWGEIITSQKDPEKIDISLMDVPPDTAFVKKIEFRLDLDRTDKAFASISELLEANYLIINISLRLSCSYDQINDMEFITHTTHAISEHGNSTVETRFGAYKKKP
ncbi:MAG: hypothetical protein HN417_04420 [Desulfobacula sp.]|jgi:hypothetical protein|nr:hypothetical protein [Desulfobacula sp.]MBT6341141.1 hypothetical protein [Desulfobacula sp.]